jgi:hypothetical protein
MYVHDLTLCQFIINLNYTGSTHFYLQQSLIILVNQMKNIKIKLNRLSLILLDNAISVFGDTYLTRNAQLDYMKHIRGLQSIMGDYQSLLTSKYQLFCLKCLRYSIFVLMCYLL